MKSTSNYPNPIGIFDSGVGGISVLRAIRGLMPEESVIYFGDHGHIPYGPRPMEQIRNFSEAITEFLLEKNLMTFNIIFFWIKNNFGYDSV